MNPAGLITSLARVRAVVWVTRVAGRLPAHEGDDLRPYEHQGGNREPLNVEDHDLISEQECWELLATTSVGRVALSIGALPAILPVQYHLDGRTLAVCLGHRELPERALNTVVAFAADAIDPYTRSGWSVQFQGRSTIPQPQPAGNDCGWTTAGQIMQIDPATISGFRVHLCPFIDSLLAQQAAPDGHQVPGGMAEGIEPPAACAGHQLSPRGHRRV